jgi:deferrochelatase/peroxidase EfeB
MDLDSEFNRRSFMASAGAALVATTALGCGSDSNPKAQPPGPTGNSSPAIDGHQAGIASRAQPYLQLAAFDLQRDSALDLRELLRRWSAFTAETAVSGRTLATGSGDARSDEPGHTSLSITYGFGPNLFRRQGRDRLGLASARPRRLEQLPAFRGDAIEPTYSGGDLCVQVCANDSQAAYDVLHALTRAASGIATPRWVQNGFLPTTPATPRNLMGFKDGTNNIDPHDEHALDEHVWVATTDEPTWMRHGSYMIVRRIRMLLDVWDTTSIPEQEATIGRHKTTGAPLGAHTEQARANLAATGVDGAPVIPSDAHIRLAAASTNGGVRILRRGYNYADDIDPATGQRDQGLIFISYQRDPAQFIRLQRHLAGHDALSKHILHTGSAIFACPPAARGGGFVGQALLT